MNDAGDMKIEFKVNFKAGRRGRKLAVTGDTPAPTMPSAGSLPRVVRLVALAIRFDQLIRDGEVKDYAEIARLGQVTRARVTQIMNLLHLAPDIQDAVLHLSRTEYGRDFVTERELRPIAAVADWRKQRVMWRRLPCGADPAYEQETCSRRLAGASPDGAGSAAALQRPTTKHRRAIGRAVGLVD